MFCERIASKSGFITENERVESGKKGDKVVKSTSGDGKQRKFPTLCKLFLIFIAVAHLAPTKFNYGTIAQEHAIHF